MKRKNLFVSFSGGETSAYMAYWLKKNKSKEYNMVFVFANTGQENEQTLEFIEKCDKEWGLNVVWIEAEVNPKKGKPTWYNIVNFKTASRNGKPFEKGISKFGIPNMVNNWCTRDLKLYPMTKYIKYGLGWDEYQTAIGIRIDEIDRISKHRKENNLIYPLVSEHPTNKAKINLFWRDQNFRLQLKSYEGNCKACWKKTKNKLLTIAIEKPEYFDWVQKMELQYENFVPEGKKNSMVKPVRWFRKNTTVQDLFNFAKFSFKKQYDESKIYTYQLDMFEDLDKPSGCNEHCEIY
jgi:hypothetical protein